MAFSSTPLPTQPNAPIDWGRGVARKTQQTPLSIEPRPTRIPRRPMQIQQGSFGTAQMMNQTEAQIIQNVVNNDFLKSIPKGTAKVASSVLSMMLPDMSKTGAECPKQHVKRVMTNILKRYDQVVHVQNPQGLPAKAGEFVGEMCAFGAVGKVVRVAEGVSIFASACEGGLYGALLSETHDTNRVAGVAFGFIGGGATTRVLFKRDVPKPLLDRVFARPQGPSRQLPDLQRPTYHSGIGSPWAEMVPTQHVQRTSSALERTVTQIRPQTIQASKSINRSNNHQFVTWVERGENRVISLGEMSDAGSLIDRGGFTKAGRALQKKTDRIGSVFPKPTGTPAEVNLRGQKVLDEILNHPDKKIYFSKLRTQNNLPTIDIVAPDGRGARFTRDGKEFITFLEP